MPEGVCQSAPPSVSFSRADARAGVRKQGFKSLTQAYCMVGRSHYRPNVTMTKYCAQTFQL